ncbi:MAG TPA: dephospho-CoA kinase [Candidatus Binatia bacterium]|nr:dephospho-CoA kinase [Candidatus Binatia bacterium]
MITIGLTGGIGCGKSAAAAILAELGALLIDADKVGHEVYEPGKPCWDALVGAFSRDILAADGAIDRKKLGARVFSDPLALKRLNALVQPRIADEINERIRYLRTRGVEAPIVVEAAVLIEAGWQWLVDEIWVITSSHERAVERVMAARGLSRQDIERRIGSQISEAERTRDADCVIRNDGTLADLRAQIERCWRERVARAKSVNEA